MFQNKVLITGKAYRPQVRQTKSGKSITTFGLSVYSGKDKTGKGIYCFIDCKVFEDLSNINGEVEITGRLSFECWEKDGKKFSKPIILADKVIGDFAGKTPTEEIKDDEIPFD